MLREEITFAYNQIAIGAAAMAAAGGKPADLTYATGQLGRAIAIGQRAYDKEMEMAPGKPTPADPGDRRRREALACVLHELTTLHGLTACDGAAPGETWKVDASKAMGMLEAAFPGELGIPGTCPLCGH